LEQAAEASGAVRLSSDHRAPASPSVGSGKGQVLVKEASVKLSARNVLKGKVKSVKPGAVNSEVLLELAPGIQLVAIITKESAERLSLSAGTPAYAIIKASSIMIATD
jgi:molybdopterin-binding protein